MIRWDVLVVIMSILGVIACLLAYIKSKELIWLGIILACLLSLMLSIYVSPTEEEDQ